MTVQGSLIESFSSKPSPEVVHDAAEGQSKRSNEGILQNMGTASLRALASLKNDPNTPSLKDASFLEEFKTFIEKNLSDQEHTPLTETFSNKPSPEVVHDVAGVPSQSTGEGIREGRGRASVMSNLAPENARKLPTLKDLTKI